MSTLAVYADSQSQILGTWTNPANALGSTVGNFATWVNATRRGEGTLELGYSGALFSAIPDGSSIDMISLIVKGFVSSSANITQVDSRVFNNGVGFAATNIHALSTSSTNIYAQIDLTANLPPLAALKAGQLTVQHHALRANNTTSSTLSLDYAQIIVTYTVPPPVVPFEGWGIPL